MSFLPRSLGRFITAANRQFPVLMLTGPRQVGKTTLLKSLCEADGHTLCCVLPFNHSISRKNGLVNFHGHMEWNSVISPRLNEGIDKKVIGKTGACADC